MEKLIKRNKILKIINNTVNLPLVLILLILVTVFALDEKFFGIALICAIFSSIILMSRFAFSIMLNCFKVKDFIIYYKSKEYHFYIYQNINKSYLLLENDIVSYNESSKLKIALYHYTFEDGSLLTVKGEKEYIVTFNNTYLDIKNNKSFKL